MNRLSQSFKIFLALSFAVLSTGLLPVYASAYAAPDPVIPTQKVKICHSAGASGTFTVNEIDTSAVDELNEPGPNGHGTDNGTHAGDIIPPFTSSPDNVVYPGKNWDAEGQAIYANDCVVPTNDSQYYLRTSHAVACGTITISLRNVSPWIYPVSYSVDGSTPNSSGPLYGPVVDNRGAAPDDQTATKTLTFSEDQNGGEVTVKYVVAAGTESDLYKNLPVGDVTTVIVDTDCQNPPVTLVECESFPKIHATNLDPNGWSLGENATFVDDGMKLDVEGNWDTTAITRTLSGELKDLGTGIDFAPNVDYLGLHVKTSKGTLTYEKFYENQDPANAGKWWSESDFGVASGMGYATFDTLENIVAANPGVTLENVRVLYTHPDVSTTTVTSVKIGCKEYTFDYEREAQPCTVTDKKYTASWMFGGYTYPEADDYQGTTNNATFEFKNDGLHISTPDVDSYVFGLVDGGSTAMADVNAMSYKTFRKSVSEGVSVTQPAYVVLVDMNGAAADGETYLIYEPYNNYPNADLEDIWQTWDAYNGGTAKWWDASVAGQQLHTWQYFVDNNPDAIVLAYGFNQGTYNAETYSIVQDMTFDCATTSFAAPQVLGDNTDKTPVETPVVPVTPSVLSATTQLPTELPATGGNSDEQTLLFVGIVVAALTYVAVLRRQEYATV